MEQFLTDVRKFMARMTGGVYFPEQFSKTEETKVLHISDTPECIYPFLSQLVEELAPDIIVHTGDVVDNYKLDVGLCETEYAKRLDGFFKLVGEEEERSVYVVPGNHDSVDILSDHDKEITIKREGSVLEIAGVKVGTAHYPNNLPPGAEINLYGHNKDMLTSKEELFLNGLVSINVILLPSGRHFHLPYPLKTDTGRQYRQLKLP